MNPKVSVIVPVYNTSFFLEECLNSLCNQSLQDIEIICIDDCSTDSSIDVLSRYAKQDKRIKVERHLINKGIGGARNTGVKVARAPLIASIDSDDFVTESMIERLYTTLIDDDSDIAACGRIEVTESGDYLRHVCPVRQLVTLGDPNHNIFHVTEPSFVQKIWKKSFFIDNNIYFDENVIYEDLSWTYRAIMRANRISIVGEAHYFYRIRKGSSTHSYGIKNLTDHVKAFDLLRKDMINLGLYEKQQIFYKQQIIDSLNYHAKTILGIDNQISAKSNYISLIYIIGRFLLEADDQAMSSFDRLSHQQMSLEEIFRSELERDCLLHKRKTNENLLLTPVGELESEGLIDKINILLMKFFKSSFF